VLTQPAKIAITGFTSESGSGKVKPVLQRLERVQFQTRGFNMDLLEVFKDSDDLVKLAARSVLFEEGGEADFMFVIVKGDISLSLRGTEIAIASQGAIIGEMALVSSDARSATATAVTNCLLASIDLHSFRLLVQHTPDFALHIMNVLAGRLRRANEALAGNFQV
jgi:CRP/FNR family cyclic AMP-dependent transcriptional regulator